MFNQQQSQPRRRRSQILFILIACAFILFPLQSMLQSTKSDLQYQQVMKMIVEPQTQQLESRNVTKSNLQKLMKTLDNKQYVGEWQNKNMSENNVIYTDSGKIKFNIHKHISNNTAVYFLKVKLFNLQYLDDGYFNFLLPITQRQGNQTIMKKNYTFFPNSTFQTYNQQISRSKARNQFTSKVNFMKISFFAENLKDIIKIQLQFQSQHMSFTTNLTTQFGSMFNNIILSILLTLICNIQLFAALKILKSLMLGEDTAQKYSLVTFLLITMWDSALMFIIFSLTMQNDELLIVYLAPLFLSTLLFTSIQMRILMTIYNAQNNQNQTSQIKFQLLVYGCLILTYPILTYFSYSTIFFLMLPFIAIPQIYKNALRGQRLKLDYNYLKLYLPRYLFLIYLRGYSKNIYDLRPNYVVCAFIILFLLLIIGYVLLQYRYGTRFLIPSLLLPKKYDYLIEQKHFINQIQEGVSQINNCAICLIPIHIQPLVDDVRMANEVGGQYIGKIMKTPCNHSYHGFCLIKWMSHKMECPTCRAKLPSLE